MTPRSIPTTIDRRIQAELPSGTYRFRTGTYTLDVHKRFKRLFEHLKRTKEGVDILEKMKSGDLDPMTILGKHELGALRTVINVDTLVRARDVIEAYIDRADISERSRQSYRHYLKDLFRESPDASLDELPDVLQALKELCALKGHRTKFVRAKALALSYCSNNGGKFSPLWTACARIKAPKQSGYVDTSGARSVAEVVATVKAMAQPHGKVFWSMCLLGGNPKEYLSDGFVIDGHAIRLNGQKNKRRTRVLPLIFADVVPPLRAEKQVRAALHDIQKTWKLKDARNTFIHWASMAGVPEVRVNLYSGHKPKTMKEHYERHDVTPYLAEDGEKIRAYILREMQPKPETVPVHVPASPLF